MLKTNKIQMFVKVKNLKQKLEPIETSRITNLLLNMSENDINIISEYKNFTEQIESMTLMQQNAKARMEFLKNMEAGSGSGSGSGHGHSHGSGGHSHG